MSIQQELEALEQDISNKKEKIGFYDILCRLEDNRDFKRVVVNGYFREEAIRLVHLKSDPSMQSEESQKSINTQIDAIGCFRGYLDEIRRQAELSRKALESDEETRQELLAEDLING